MKVRRISSSVLVQVLLLTLLVGLTQAQGPEPQREIAAPQAVAVSGGFTYQGFLSDGGSPANGEYDLQFKLHDVPSGDSQVGGTLTREDVIVADGLVTVTLDFGSVYDGTGLWLEVSVRPGDSGGSYTVLSPRQEITPAPYAIYAASTHWDNITGVPDLQQRVSGTCAAGSSIRVVNADGTVDCETDNDTTYTDGDGLDLTGSEFSVDFGGNGSATTVPYSDHTHDGRYYTESELNTSGGGGQVNWDNVTNEPHGQLAKATIYAECDGASSSILRSFVAPLHGTLTIGGSNAGECSITFYNPVSTVDLSDNYWFAVPIGTDNGSAYCEVITPINILRCVRYDFSGAKDSGKIMVLVY